MYKSKKIIPNLLKILLLSSILGCDLFNNEDATNSLYTWPKKVFLEDNHFAIINLGDLRLSKLSVNEQTKESIQKESTTIPVGGFDQTVKYLERIYQQYGERVIFVSAGNLINPNENLEHQFELMKKFSVIANVGSSELSLLDNPEIKNLSFISSNLIALDKKVLNIPTYIEKEIFGKKIGFIGLTHDQINPDSLKFHFKAFNKTLSKVLYKAHRKHRADMVILLIFGRVECGQTIAKRTGKSILQVGFNPNEDYCDEKTIINKLTRLIPPNTVDAVIMAGPGHKLNHYINNIPVIKNPEEKKYISKLSISIEKEDKTKIFNPVKLCHIFFKESLDCFHEDPSVDHSKKTAVKFLGKSL